MAKGLTRTADLKAMVYCRYCNTEYGGIRGVTADKCPRCVAREDATNRQRSISPATSLGAPQAQLQLVAMPPRVASLA